MAYKQSLAGLQSAAYGDPYADEPSDADLADAMQQVQGAVGGLLSNDAILSALSKRFPINQGNLARYSDRVTRLRGTTERPQFSTIQGKFWGV